MRALRLAAVCLTVVFLACVPRVVSPTEALEAAAAHVGPGADAQTLALAGFHALLMEGQVAHAQAHFDAAVAADSKNPLALMGQLVLARRLAQPQKELEIALDLLERAPRHPLTVSAARVVLDHSGESKVGGERIAQRVPELLKVPQLPDAAHLLRASLAIRFQSTDDVTQHQAILSDMGVPTEVTLAGPFSAWHRLATLDPTPPEREGNVDELSAGPFGVLPPRVLRFADGKLSLAGEPAIGDVFVTAVDVTVPAKARYVLRTISGMDHAAILDGTVVLTRSTSTRPASTLTTRVVKLDPGVHRLLVRFAREEQSGQIIVALQRLDGQPAGLTFQASKGAAPRWDGARIDDDEDDPLYASAEATRAALAPELGDALARFLAAIDGAGRDLDGARRLMAGLPDTVSGPAVAMLRAELSLEDRSVPSRVSRGRATRELEASLQKDPTSVAAKLLTAQLALDDGRQLDALELVRAARDAHQPVGAPVLLLLAKIQLALGLDAAAAGSAREAAQVLPGACEAVVLQYDLARRRDAMADAETLLGASSHCPGARLRTVEHRRARGDIRAAIAAAESQFARDQSQVGIALTLSGLYVSERRYDDALALLDRVRRQWPRQPQILKSIADVHEVAGHPSDALAARELALALDGTDLPLRRAVERQKSGRELLDAYAIDTAEALKSYEAAPGSEDATSSLVLDAAAIEAYPDGTMIDRIHIIQKALDQQGVQEVAEVQIPDGATVLKLRTLKPDGRTLEPEHIDGKEGVSLPGVQVGDLIEYEYLLAHPPRGPGQPGFTASAFYFQVAQQPNARSSYVVIAPKGSGLAVDAHHVTAPGVKVEGDREVFRHEERRVPPFIPEPGGPPSPNEWLPFVSVGAGQRGNDGLIATYADAFLERGTITTEVEAFARGLVKDRPLPLGREAVEAVYAAVHQKLSGRDGGLPVSAAASVAQDRGSRLWLIKASLEALGFETRLAAVRTFTTDPDAYVFPNEALFPYLCLRVKLPDGEYVWLDAFVRFAPFGVLPELALGGLEATLLPEPGRPLEKVRTPARSTRVGKSVTLDLALSETGELTGKGRETYTGYEAAQLAEALESMTADQREQALQSALSRYFGGADLSKLEVTMERSVGAPVTIAYELVARRFARVEGTGRLVASSLTYPFMVGRRFLAVPRRTTPLFIDGTEACATSATVKLPAGWSLRDPVAELKLVNPAGHYERRETQRAGVLTIEEQFELIQSRVAPAQYDPFVQFAGELDLAQQRDLLFERPVSP